MDGTEQSFSREQELNTALDDLHLTSPDTSMWLNGHRPDYGTAGIHTHVVTNHLRFDALPSNFHRYIVTYADPPPSFTGQKAQRARPVTSRKDRLRILAALRQTNWFSGVAWAPSHACDFVYTLAEFKTNPYVASNVMYRLRSGKPQVLDFVKFTRDTSVQVTVKPSSVVGTNQNPASSNEGLEILNAFATKHALFHPGLTEAGSYRFFLNDDKTPAGPILHARRGYFLSARPGEDAILLNVNAVTSCFFRPISVATIMKHLLLKLGNDVRELSALLENVQVRIEYSRGSRDIGTPDERNLDEEYERKKTITCLGMPVRDQRFYESKKDNLGRSVLDYYTKELGLAVKELSLPCVNVGANSPERPEAAQYIPPEYLTVVPHEPAGFRLSELFVSDIIKTAARPADMNRDLIAGEGLRVLGLVPNTLQSAGFEISEQLMNIPARILKTPTIGYGQGKDFRPMTGINEASWNLSTAKSFTSYTKLLQIPVFYFTDPDYRFNRDEGPQEVVKRMLRGQDGLEQQLRFHGFQLDPKRPLPEYPVEENKWKEELANYLKRVATVPPNLCIVVLPSKDTGRYNAIKRMADLEFGANTVSFVFANGAKANKQFWSNQALKLNIKAGGLNHLMSEAELKNIGCSIDELIIFSADVVHLGGPPNKRGCPSVASVVASTGKDFSNYLPSMRLQRSLQERISGIEDMVRERIRVWMEKNPNKLPKAILFYRDGVGESQYHWIRNQEIDGIFDAWKSIPELREIELKLSLLLVTKRHHVRVYPSTEQKAGEVSKFGKNMKPGTVIDHAITHSYLFDFFLQPHAAIKGTARPGHYTFLRNDLKLDSDTIQRITHALCYNYGKATKGISLPAPAFLADLCCDRAKIYMQYDIELMPQQYGQSRDEWFDRCMAQYKRLHPEWTQPIGPWHPKLNDTMFYI